MSIFRSNPQSADLSALLDNELPHPSAEMIEAAVREGTLDSRELHRLRRVHTLLESPQIPSHEIAAAQVRVRLRLDRSLRSVYHRDPRPWWERSVTIPMPVAATAMVAILMFAVIVASRIAPLGGAGAPQETAGEIAQRAESLNLQVNVNGDQTEQLLQWLNERQSVETVTIQLPDTAQFQLRGEPVFLRPELPGEDTMNAASDESFEITPLEESEE
ncbi:MAG: hypothetical protein R6U25_05545 [Alkalispirochaeta sp.]